MKRERLHSLITFVSTTIVAIALGLLVSGCSKDCPTCPKEPHVPDYHLVYSYVGSTIADKYVLTYSTKSGQVIDSAHYLDYPFDHLAVTSEGNACYMWLEPQVG
jgi:hypothetical protein